MVLSHPLAFFVLFSYFSWLAESYGGVVLMAGD